MFNRFFALIVAVFLCVVFCFVVFWQTPSGMALYSDSPVTKAHRITQDLGGKWDSYDSLRQAFAQQHSNYLQKDNLQTTRLVQANSVIIPSNQAFHVAVKRFQVTGKWGFKTAQFVIEGVYGKTRVFLNGIDEVHYLGEFEGVGGTYTISISPSRFDFDGENVIYLELSSGTIQKSMLFGWLSPEQGKITGQIRLEAVSETTLDETKTTLAYDELSKKLEIGISLQHHMTLEYGPWVIHGVLKDNGQKIAECLLPLDTNGEFQQNVALSFELDDPHYWSPDHPDLYELDMVLTNNLGDYDSIQMPIGLRANASTHEKWVIDHQDFPVNGEIVSSGQADILRNHQQVEDYMRKLKSRGMNVVYFMGFFPDEGWLYSADRLGVGVWLEMPLHRVAKENIPSYTAFEELITIAGRHPSVMAWTGGKGIEVSSQEKAYYQDLRKRILNLPVYALQIGDDKQNLEDADPAVIWLDTDGLEGHWGRLNYAEASDPHTAVSQTADQPYTQSWEHEKTAATAWLCWLFLYSILKRRNAKWNYRELLNTQPKRSVRIAFFWGSLGFINRRITLGGLLTALLYKLPLNPWPWLPYDFTLLISLRNQSPWLIWLFLSLAFVLLKIFQVGLAAPSFPKNPGAFALGCWLERRTAWILLVAIAWVMTVYGTLSLWYLPIAVYAFFWLVLIPVQVRDVWKAGGKVASFMLLPMTFLLVGSLTVIYYRYDFLYLIKIVIPQIQNYLGGIY